MHSLATLSLRAGQLHSQVRFAPVLHLQAGDLLGVAAEEMTEFEERASFGPRSESARPAGAADWMASRLERIASAAWAQSATGRPILVRSPLAALTDRRTAPACDEAIRRTTMCQQEFCLTFTDSAFCSADGDLVGHVARLRQHGFRVGLDLRHSWQAPLGHALILMIDTIRVNADLLAGADSLNERIRMASDSGILIVADNASWRDADDLEAAGIMAGISPRTDA